MKLKILPNIYGVFYFDNYSSGIARHFTSDMFHYWRAVTQVKQGGEGRYAYVHFYSGWAALFQGYYSYMCVAHRKDQKAKPKENILKV